MKFFYKLLLSITLLLTVSLSIMQYVGISSSMRNMLQNAVGEELSRHRMSVYTLEAEMLQGSVTADGLLERLQSMYGEWGSVELRTEPPAEWLYEDIAEGEAAWHITGSEGTFRLTVASMVEAEEQTWYLLTSRDLSGIYSQTLLMQRRGLAVYLAVLIAVLGATVILARWLTRPYKEIEGRLNEKIAELDLKVEEQDEFIRNFTHEIKTPMTAVVGWADTIYQKRLDEEGTRRAAESILNEGMRLEALSFKLLELSRLEHGEDLLFEEIDVRAFFEDIRIAILPDAVAHQVRFRAQADEGWIRAEIDLFKTLVMNLLDNACKSGAAEVRLTGQVKGGAYEISVYDDGRGISPEDLSRITEAFYMVDKSRSRSEHGAGLGLALAARIAKLHGTRLEYDSAVGRGTVVRVSLPLAEIEEGRQEDETL